MRQSPKPQLALEMVAAAVTDGVPFRWVGGDGVYGDSPTFVQGVRLLGKWYVLDSSADARVWTDEPRGIPPEERPKPGRGRPCTRPLVVGEALRVDEVAAALPAAAWRRLTEAEGSQGPRVYEYAEAWAWFGEEGLPGTRAAAGAEVLGPGAGAEVPPLQCPGGGQVTEAGPGAGVAVDDRGGHQVGQGAMRPGRLRDAGLAGITTRRCRCWRWRSWSCRGCGWGRGEPGMTVPKVRALMVHLLAERAWDVAEVLERSAWRQERNRRAAVSHRKRRLSKLRRRQRSKARGPALSS